MRALLRLGLSHLATNAMGTDEAVTIVGTSDQASNVYPARLRTHAVSARIRAVSKVPTDRSIMARTCSERAHCRT